MKAVVTESGGLQTLNVYIAGTLRLSTRLIGVAGTIDDSWSAGYVGLWRDKTDAGSVGILPARNDKPTRTLDRIDRQDAGATRAVAGTDQNADGDIDDAGDHLFVNFDFAGSWQTLSLSYDDNGNLTADGVYKYRYDAWNRLVATCYPSGDITAAGQRIGQYEYDGKNRRLRRVVTNRGAGAWQADANGEYRYFYDDQWRIVEVRNGSGQVKQQWLFGTQYVDEIVLMDNNGPTDTDDDCDPDTDLISEIAVAGDQRYFYHQDRNWNVVALSTITDGSSYVNGDIVERYSYTTYGEPTVIAVTASSGGTGNVRGASLASNVFLHQGLPIDREKASYQNRWREYSPPSRRFVTADPQLRTMITLLGDRANSNHYEYVSGEPTDSQDPRGLCQIRWRRASGIHGGLDVDRDGDGNPDSFVDYGNDPNPTLLGCCRDNQRYPTNRYVVSPWPAPTTLEPWDTPTNSNGGSNNCMCDCFKNNIPNQYGNCCGYALVPIWPGETNSNSGLRMAIAQCEAQCGQTIARPGWAAGLPGYNASAPPHSGPPCP